MVITAEARDQFLAGAGIRTMNLSICVNVRCHPRYYRETLGRSYNRQFFIFFQNNLNYAMCIERVPGSCSVTYTNAGYLQIVNYDTGK